MNYKKIIRNQEIRFKILKLLNWIPDKIMLKIQYRIKTNRKLNLKNPQRYTEKLQWYKLYYRNPIMTQCADKYAVRDYIKSKGLESILNELYGVFNSVDEIDFNSLPKKFVLKTTNGSETNIICRDKSKLNLEKAKEDMSNYMNHSTKSAGREWAYDNIKPKIVLEKLLENKNNEDLRDYKFLCFNGKVKYIVVDADRFIEHKRNIYDRNWKELEVLTDCKKIDYNIEKPANLNEMIKISEKLSEDFPHVRVDLYNVDGKIIFGELTFYPWSGYVNYNPDIVDFEFGKNFDLEKYEKEKK